MSLVDRARNITLRPAAEWPVIATEDSSVRGLYAGYIAPLALIGPIALFIGLSIVGITVPFIGTIRTPLVPGLTQAIISFAFILLAVFLMTLLVNALAPTFGAQKNNLAALKLVAYSYTPALVAGIFGIFPPFAVLGVLAALWGLYLFYVGVPIIMKTTKDKALPYTVVTVVSAFVLGFVLSAMVSVVMGSVGMTAFGPGYRAFGSSPVSDESQGKQIVANILSRAMGGGAANQKQADQVVNGVTEAGKQAEQAEQSKDPNAQAQAGVNVLKSLITGGNKAVKPIAREDLKTLLPDSVIGMQRTSSDSNSGTVAGISGSSANATYADGQHNTVELEVGDMGNLGGLAALAKLGANIVQTESDAGYEKNVDVDGRTVHEKWTNDGKRSELFEIVDDRYAVSVTGQGVDMDTALKALQTVDVAKFAQLGQKSN